VAEIMRELGYMQRSRRWYRNHGDILHVVSLQKSSWGDYYYLNLGIWLQPLESNPAPPEHHCHIRCRAGEFPDDPKDLDKALNEEDYWRMDPDQRKQILKLALCNAEFHFFRNLTSIRAVKEFLATKESRNKFVTKALRDFLGVP
jgi:hypothetical protein